MLERSRTSPLNIDLDGPTSTETIRVVLDNIARIENLSIAQGNWELHSCQTRLLKLRQDASQLRSLNVWYYSSVSRHSSLAFKLSANTFQRPVSLQRIRLKALDYDWNIFPISSLTSLSPDYSKTSDSPSWIQLQDALRGMPLLERIKFDFNDLGLFSPGSSLLQPLHLPRLHTLSIMGGTAPVIGYFLSHAKFPRLSGVCIVCPLRRDNDYIITVEAVLSLLAESGFERPNCLDIGPEDFSLSQPPSTYQEDSRQFRFMCGYLATRGAMRRLIRAMMKSASDLLSHISRLIVARSPLVSEELADLFGSLPELNSIQADYDVQAVIECLRIPSSHTPDISAPFASVREIILGNSRDRADYISSMVGILYSCLKLRREFGFPLMKLNLDWKLTPEQVESLRDVVDDLFHKGGDL